MRPDQVERFYREYSALGGLIGVRAGELPDSWTEFQAYFSHASQTVLEPNLTVHRVLRSVQMSPPPLPLPRLIWDAVRIPARRALWLGGVGLLAPALRRRLEIPWSDADQRALDRLGRLSRALTPVMPARLRIMGPNALRVRQRAIARGPLGHRGAERHVPGTAEHAA
jgi:uncharacterized protein (DUF2236 family)